MALSPTKGARPVSASVPRCRSAAGYNGAGGGGGGVGVGGGARSSPSSPMLQSRPTPEPASPLPLSHSEAATLEALRQRLANARPTAARTLGEQWGKRPG